ncbi:MAG: hypothetical protein JSR24_21195 [Proteobacteria bacterium]|nr:hypothetical protein [Pseudomonadota bacterium]
MAGFDGHGGRIGPDTPITSGYRNTQDAAAAWLRRPGTKQAKKKQAYSGETTP